MSKPNSPADPRLDGKPYYINEVCEDCGEELKQVQDSLDVGLHDEFECGCEEGIWFDMPCFAKLYGDEEEDEEIREN